MSYYSAIGPDRLYKIGIKMLNKSNLTISVIDTETTGLNPFRHDRIIEVAIITIDQTGKIIREYETLINPKRDLGPTNIHGITGQQIINAPEFSDVSGDILEEISKSDLIAGHNFSFDKMFLTKEFERIGIELPKFPSLCTSLAFGRTKLSECLRELGIDPGDGLHSAIVDARHTASLIHYMLENVDPSFIPEIKKPEWPTLPAKGTKCYTRSDHKCSVSSPPRFLEKITGKLHHDPEKTKGSILAYLSLIDRVVEDRNLTVEEEDLLAESANTWGLTRSQAEEAHYTYLSNLAFQALSDGILTDSETKDLERVSLLLGVDLPKFKLTLDSAKTKVDSLDKFKLVAKGDLAGQRVCFTWEIVSTIKGAPITRELAESLAESAGLTVASGISKKVDILVVADPYSNSSKARKAREYNIRILPDSTFFKMINVRLD